MLIPDETLMGRGEGGTGKRRKIAEITCNSHVNMKFSIRPPVSPWYWICLKPTQIRKKKRMALIGVKAYPIGLFRNG